MTFELPPQGSVIEYPYLWVSQRDAGEIEGRKNRPVCLVLRIADAEHAIHHIVLLAISSQPPHEDQVGLEIPDTERRRAGLSRYPRAWIMVSEYNYDIAERSWYLQPSKPPIGQFSTAFLRTIAQAFKGTMAAKTAKVDRTV